MNVEQETESRRLLVLNCHEAWVYQLGGLGYPLDIIIGLKGRHTVGWDVRMRPVPANCRFVSLEEALAWKGRYYCIITHNITDLMDVRERPEPRILVLHCSLQGRIAEERPSVTAEQMKEVVHRYVELVGCHVVASSRFKGESWGFTEDVVTFGVEVDDYLPYSGEVAEGLRICNFVNKRRKILLWDFHEEVFGDIAVRLVGHNPDIAGVSSAANWDELKRLLQSHRFYIHTADPRYEEGYNMASMEAMAAGLAVIGNRHPSSPIVHGVSGFLSDEPGELGDCARLLLADRELAVSMGREAQKVAREHFSLRRFSEGFLRSIETARAKWRGASVRPVEPIRRL